MGRLLLNYEDVDVYEEDLQLLNPRKWLNDTCINYCYRKLEKKSPMPTTLLMDPAVVSFLVIQATEEEEISELSKSLDLVSREWIFFPLTNSERFTESSFHWSLLLCNRRWEKLYHFDSFNSTNLLASCSVGEKISTLLHK